MEQKQQEQEAAESSSSSDSESSAAESSSDSESSGKHCSETGWKVVPAQTTSHLPQNLVPTQKVQVSTEGTQARK